MGLLTKHLMDRPPPFAQVGRSNTAPPELERLVMQTLAKAAGERPPTMLEVARRIDALLASTPRVAAARKRGRGGVIAGIAAGAVLLLGGGGVAGWYFVAGPGSSAPGGATPSTPIPQWPTLPVVAPQAQPPVAGQIAPQPDPALEPLQAVPEGTPPKPGQSPGGSKIPSGAVKRCSFTAGEDRVARAVRDALKAKEPQIRLCAKELAGEAAARFSFSVAANARQVSEIAEKTATGLEACLKPSLAVSIGESDATARTGDVTVSMKGKGGSESCEVQVLAREKGSAHKPKLPIDLGKNQDEIVSTAKETVGQLIKKLEELKKGSTESDSGN